MDSHFSLGGPGGAELSSRQHASAPSASYSSSAPPASGSGQNYRSPGRNAYYSPSANEPFSAYQPPRDRGPASVPEGATYDGGEGYGSRTGGIRMPYGAGRGEGGALASGVDPQSEYEHYARRAGGAPRRIFDPRNDRVKMKDMQRYQASGNANAKRYNPVLQRYANDDAERAARGAESAKRKAQLRRHARAPQPELGSVRDLHVGKLPSNQRRRGAGAVGPPPDSDIFNPEPLPYRPGKRHSEIDYTAESYEWWNLNREPPPPRQPQPPHAYAREARQIREKNEGNNMTSILQPDRNKNTINMLHGRSPSPDHRKNARRSAVVSPYALEPSNTDLAAPSYTTDLLRHASHVPTPAAPPVPVSNLSNIGLDHTEERRHSSKRVFSDDLHHRSNYDIVSGHAYDGSKPSTRFSRRPLNPKMQAGKGVAETLYYRGAGDPGADPETNNGVGYGLTGSQRKNFAANMWGETGAANWQEVNPTFKFKRY